MDELIEKAFDAAVVGKRVLWASPDWGRTRAVIGAFEELRADCSEIIRIGRGKPEFRIWFRSGGVIHFVSANGAAARGCRADLLCLDGVTDERALASLLPCAAGGGEIASNVHQ